MPDQQAGADQRIARRLRLRDLHMLRVVAELGSMAQAAERLAMSQPAISKAIAGMERSLGAPLLDRGPRGVEPTAYGRVLLARGTAMLDELRLGIEEIRFLADPATGRLRIGTTEPMTAIVSAVILRLSPRYPRMTFEVEMADTGLLFQRLRDRSLDLAVSRTAGAAAEPDLLVDPLFDDPLVVMAGRRNPLARRRRILLAELMAEPWVLPPPDSFLGGMIAAAFRLRGLDPPRAVTTRSVRLAVNLLGNGCFLSVLPSAMLRFRAQYPALAALPVELAETRRPIALITLGNRSPAPAARLFTECAHAVARLLPGGG
ncbi:LysR family transcriptional regulator [Siccirubricoccus sp. G192]|uniref:LysR family transcriptional regulator n=1 Tax=Siccirubricoccus sp. G192 TaxID=2849651 RepID=UPI001C2C9883|nr:LysR family transcriptional regulator [Siccirubricoccus sp. G192]MBV1799896.1 LysR family transcriptional regulator [Siccirubricoccus sp. G192]